MLAIFLCIHFIVQLCADEVIIVTIIIIDTICKSIIIWSHCIAIDIQREKKGASEKYLASKKYWNISQLPYIGS